jgi:hypothetical protein
MANLLRAGLPTLVAALALGCAGAASDPRFDPSESVLEVVAVLRRHVPDDTYRFEPAVDVTGRNVYRASLVRLENLERVHADALRSGYLDDVIAFAKGRALERLRSFELAAEAYRRAAAREGVLEPEALRGAALCDALAEAARIGFDLERPLAADANAGPASADEALAAFDQRVALLEAMAPDVEGSHYAHVVREEIERADMARARWFDAVRLLAPDGNVRALAERQRLVVRHRESRLHNRHLLALADLYADVAAEYVEAHPPEGLLFDSPTFQELAESAARLYEVVANQDGTSEKLEAQQRLEAFLAFTLRVDRDRFTR